MDSHGEGEIICYMYQSLTICPIELSLTRIDKRLSKEQAGFMTEKELGKYILQGTSFLKQTNGGHKKTQILGLRKLTTWYNFGIIMQDYLSLVK